MSKPAASSAPKRHTPTRIALGVMLLACGLMLTALVVLAQGAVAAEAEQIVRQQTEASAQDQVQAEAQPAPQGGEIVSGRFVLGAAPTAQELALAQMIETSSVGGGFVAGAELHVTIEVRPTPSNG
jgi:hypothetical protein